MKNLDKKLKKIKIVLTDVDGVLTDGGMYYSANGDVMKKFHARDGMGISLLKKNGIPTIIVTKEKTQMVKKWVKKMSVAKLYDGIIKKEEINQIIGLKVLSIKRRSKYLIFFFTKNIVMIAHLGMTGKFFIVNKKNIKKKTSFYYSLDEKKDSKHDRIVLVERGPHLGVHGAHFRDANRDVRVHC